MPMLPVMKIGDVEITRLIVGSNPFTGKSHLNAAASAQMRDYYTEKHIFDTLRRCEEAGINAVQSRGSMPIMGIIDRYRANGGRLLYLCQTGKSEQTFTEELDELMRHNPAAVCLHGELADALYYAGKTEVIGRLLDEIRRRNVPAGLCAHCPQVLIESELRGWKPDYYMASVYNLTLPGRIADADGECFHEADVPVMYGVIRQLTSPVIALKILGAGRRCSDQTHARAAFEEAFASMKKGDGVLVGMFDRDIDQPFLDARYTADAIAKLGV